jgi:hypothetical protein
MDTLNKELARMRGMMDQGCVKFHHDMTVTGCLKFIT